MDQNRRSEWLPGSWQAGTPRHGQADAGGAASPAGADAPPPGESTESAASDAAVLAPDRAQIDPGMPDSAASQPDPGAPAHDTRVLADPAFVSHLEAFLGREPDADAFLRKLGIG